ncbi:MAG TPA: hypothetical protein VGQ09_22470 [Chitinophagaceae bacterium]|jgi:hypothetical protein|nr:hypothetical protein [Chitinophagaceae bacterium]
MNIGITIIGIVYYIIAFLFAWTEGRKRTIGFVSALLIAFLIPFFGIFIVESFRLKNADCKWCGNKYNEAEYCGICGKNSKGEMKSEVIK